MAVCLLLGLFFCRITAVSDAMGNALTLCATSLVPSIFPFLLLTDILLHLPSGKSLLLIPSKAIARLFRCSNAAAVAYLIGSLFGFPLGAKAIAEYYKDGEISKKEASRALLFSSNTGPAFVIGGIGCKLFASLSLGIFLYTLQIFISLMLGILTGFFVKDLEREAYKIKTTKHFSISECMQRSVFQMLSICGYVCFFSVLASLFSALLPSVSLRALLYATLEIGGAASFLSALPSLKESVPLLSFAISFSGLSVYFQLLDCLSTTDVRCPYYLPTKLFCGVFAYMLSSLLLNFLT